MHTTYILLRAAARTIKPALPEIPGRVNNWPLCLLWIQGSSLSQGVSNGEVIAIHGSIVMAKGRLCVSFNSLIFGRVFLEVSFLASFSFVGASDLSLSVFQSSCVSPYIITPPSLFFLLASQAPKDYLILHPTAPNTNL